MINIGVFLPTIAVVIDGVIGDPRTGLHPVVIIGKLISGLERMLLRTEASSAYKKTAGLVLVFIVLGLTYVMAWVVQLLLWTIDPLVGYFGAALLLSFAISPRSLAKAGQEIRSYLLQGDMEQARSKVGWIVGRDTAQLDEAEVARATVETVAENIVDGIISPLFYAILGGAPLAFLYRAVNTLDSMIGYKNDKYLDFGMVAARVDDVFNYVPARITGLLIIIASLILRYDAKGAANSILRDAAKHPSPNSGFPEAGVAGALGIRLGGQNYYGGVPSFREYMGEPLNDLTSDQIRKTIKLMYAVTILFLFVVTAASLAFL
jgi:adenosylcobinamide-phosphate synthase